MHGRRTRVPPSDASFEELPTRHASNVKYTDGLGLAAQAPPSPQMMDTCDAVFDECASGLLHRRTTVSADIQLADLNTSQAASIQRNRKTDSEQHHPLKGIVQSDSRVALILANKEEADCASTSAPATQEVPESTESTVVPMRTKTQAANARHRPPRFRLRGLRHFQRLDEDHWSKSPPDYNRGPSILRRPRWMERAITKSAPGMRRHGTSVTQKWCCLTAVFVSSFVLAILASQRKLLIAGISSSGELVSSSNLTGATTEEKTEADAAVLRPTPLPQLQPRQPPWPPVTPPRPLTVPSAVVRLEALNARYARGRPSNHFNEAGVLATMMAYTLKPWIPLVHHRRVDRISGSMINQQLPGLFRAPYGFVLDGPLSEACYWCAYAFDAGTNGPGPCHRNHPYPLSQFADMMRAPQGHRNGITSAVYNEVVLKDVTTHNSSGGVLPGCYSQALPQIVEAIFVQGDLGEDSSVRAMHEAFVSYFNLPSHSAPLLLRYHYGIGFAPLDGIALAAAAPLPPPTDRGDAASPPESSDSPSQRLAVALNEEFSQGHPSNDPAQAGVFVHMFDATTHVDQGLPWETYWPHSKRLADRISGSIMNARLPYLFAGVWGHPERWNATFGPLVGSAGFIVSSDVVVKGLLCSYMADAATVNDRAHQGCGRRSVFPKTDLVGMLQAHEARSVGCVAMNNFNNCYNEVILSATEWRSALPDSIEAIFYPAGATAAEQAARLVREQFNSHFDRSIPLLTFTSALGDRGGDPLRPFAPAPQAPHG